MVLHNYFTDVVPLSQWNEVKVTTAYFDFLLFIMLVLVILFSEIMQEINCWLVSTRKPSRRLPQNSLLGQCLLSTAQTTNLFVFALCLNSHNIQLLSQSKTKDRVHILFMQALRITAHVSWPLGFKPRTARFAVLSLDHPTIDTDGVRDLGGGPWIRRCDKFLVWTDQLQIFVYFVCVKHIYIFI